MPAPFRRVVELEAGGLTRGAPSPGARPDAKWFPLWRSVPHARARLLCLPGAGSGASLFQSWRRLLPDVELLAAQLPGREHRVREAPMRELAPLVEGLAAAVESLPQRGATPLPLAVFGHSLGALVGFALCRALAGKLSPCRLFAAGGRAPHLPHRRILSSLPLTTLLDELVKIGGTSPLALAEPELVALIEPVLRADLLLAETCVLAPAPPLDVPITVLGGTDDRHVHSHELEAWRDLTTAGCTVDYLPGGHFFVLEQSSELTRRLRSLLA